MLSLTFNRGTGGFGSTKDRYREMHEIRRPMTARTAADFAKVRAQWRAMTRIWGDASSLAKRRREEANLLEEGLSEVGLVESLTVPAGLEALKSPALPVEDHAEVSDQVDQTEDPAPTDLFSDRLLGQLRPGGQYPPGRRNTGFSSFGCLTLPGNYDLQTKTHSGLWADFRLALGMGKDFAPSDGGKRFSAMALTSLDAALAVSLRVSGDRSNEAEAAAAVLRLRFGPKGPAVARLQQPLGLQPDKSQLVDPVTRAALIKLQQDKLGRADGVLSGEMAQDLGLSAP